MRTTSGPVIDRTVLQAATSIRRAISAFSVRTRFERAGELTFNQTGVLGLLFRFGSLTPTEIADRMRMLPQSLTRTLASLEETGMVTRTPDPADGRQSILSLTGDGRRALRREMRPRDVWLATALESHATEGEREILLRASAILERLSTVDALGVPLPE
jgi:DNA-binding MarR family transcriptional regulator